MRRFTLLTSLIFALVGLLWPRSVQAQTAVIDLQPSSSSVTVSDQFSLAINLTDVTNLGAFQFTLHYDPALIEPLDLAIGAFLSSTGRSVIPLGPSLNPTLGTLTFGAVSFGDTPGALGSGTLATLNFQALTPGLAPFSLTATQLTDPDANLIAHRLLDTQVTIQASTPTPTPTPSPTPTATASASLAFLPQGPAYLNEALSLDLFLDTNAPITGVDAWVEFNPTQLRVDQVSDNHLLPTTPLLDFDNSQGIIRLSQVVDPGAPFTGQGSLATLTLTPLATGPTALHYRYTPGSKADTNVIAAADGADILLPPADLNLNVAVPADLQLQFTTPSENPQLGHTLTGTLTDLDQTVSASLSADLTGLTTPYRLDSNLINQLKTFFFKTSGFLRRRFELTVQPGLNLIHLGLLKAGDLNHDGMVNTVDLSLMYDQWFTLSPAEGFVPADFNRDGIVNSADHWHLISNFLQEDE